MVERNPVNDNITIAHICNGGWFQNIYEKSIMPIKGWKYNLAEIIEYLLRRLADRLAKWRKPDRHRT